MAKKRIEVTDVNYNQKHLVEVEENDLPTPEVSAEQLLSKMEGDTEEAGVNVDLSADGKKVKITLDQDVKEAISGNNTIEVQFTEDDWDEDEQEYSKHLEVNNVVMLIRKQDNPVHEGSFVVYCPYFKVLHYKNSVTVPDTENISAFAGLINEPENRYLSLGFQNEDLICITVFNGCVSVSAIEY